MEIYSRILAIRNSRKQILKIRTAGEETKEWRDPILVKDWNTVLFYRLTSPKEGVGFSSRLLLEMHHSKPIYYNGKEVKGIMDGSAATEVVDKFLKREKWLEQWPVIYNVYGKPAWMDYSVC